MNRPVVLTVLFCLAFPARAVDLSDDATLGSLKLEYDVRRSEHWKPLQQLDELYRENLEKLRQETVKAGKLDRVLAVKNELEGFEEGETPEVDATFPRLRRLQSIYRQTRKERAAEVAEKTRPLRETYEAELRALQVRLTREEKLEEAIEVRQALETLADDDAASIAGVPSAPDEPNSVADDTPEDFTFTQGRLHAFGKMGETEIDLSAAEGITDFIDVAGNSKMWVGLRATGEAVGWHRETGAFTQAGIEKLVVGTSALGIDKEGRLVRLDCGSSVSGIASVVRAAASNHGLAVLKDGTVEVWGDCYPPGAKGTPFPPRSESVEKIENATMVAASRYLAWASTADGDLYYWGRHGREGDSIPLATVELRGVTGVWATEFDAIAKTRRGFFRIDWKEKVITSTDLESDPSIVRTGGWAAIGFEKDRWSPLLGLYISDADQREELGSRLASFDDRMLPFLYNEGDRDERWAYLLWLAEDTASAEKN